MTVLLGVKKNPFFQRAICKYYMNIKKHPFWVRIPMKQNGTISITV